MKLRALGQQRLNGGIVEDNGREDRLLRLVLIQYGFNSSRRIVGQVAGKPLVAAVEQGIFSSRVAEIKTNGNRDQDDKFFGVNYSFAGPGRSKSSEERFLKCPLSFI